MNQNRYEVVIVGGGPAGLTAARVLGEAGATVLVIEKDRQIAERVRTSGGTWIHDMAEHGVPESMCHPFRRVRLVTPGSEATFEHADARACVLDVRRVYRHLAARSAGAGALVQTGTAVQAVTTENDRPSGVTVRHGDGRSELIRADIVVDASGYAAGRAGDSACLSLRAPMGSATRRRWKPRPTIRRRPSSCSAGSSRQRVTHGPFRAGRVECGSERASRSLPPDRAPPSWLGDSGRAARKLRDALAGARTVEIHRGIVPFSPPSAPLVWHGLVRVGDAAGHASALAGEGSDWPWMPGRWPGGRSWAR